MSLKLLPEIIPFHTALSVLEAVDREDCLTLAGSVEELLKLAVQAEQYNAFQSGDQRIEPRSIFIVEVRNEEVLNRKSLRKNPWKILPRSTIPATLV